MRILIIDDESSIRRTLRLRMTQWGHEVYDTADGNTALSLLSRQDCDVVLTDLRMPGLGGEEIVRRVRQNHSRTEVVVATGYATVEAAIETMKAGAAEFLLKPLNFDHVKVVLGRIEEQLRVRQENEQLRGRVEQLSEQAEQRYRLGNLIGKSRPMQKVYDMINIVAPQECTVSIFGESGTGKEVVARAIHFNSMRKDRPLITVDCGTLTETLLEAQLFGHEKGAFTGADRAMPGCFEQADGGTIFLDEVNNASPAVQQKLLRVIQEKVLRRLGGEANIQVDVRVIAASNKNLENLVREGLFREDLYYRLNVVPISLPALRDRNGDALLLARHFINHFAEKLERKKPEMSHEAIRQLDNYTWPGNVRELTNIIERTLILTAGDTIHRFDLESSLRVPDETSAPCYRGQYLSLDPPLPEQVAQLERNYLELAMQACRGQINAVVERSGVKYRTLYRKLQRYGLDRKSYR